LTYSGQPYFTGGEYFINYDKHGLILITTPDGLWAPPSIVSLENGTKQPWVVTSMNLHIEADRILQVSSSDDFANINLEHIGIKKDSVVFDMNSLNDGKYFLRVGTAGQIGRAIWSEPLEFILFSGLKLRYVDQVQLYSSQYGGNWSATQLIGKPDVYPNYGDLPGSWASATPDAQREFLELSFLNPNPIHGVVVFETFNPGAIDTLYVRNPINQQWIKVWSGTAKAAAASSRAFTILFPQTLFPVSEIRLAINSPVVGGYNEIDAVGLIDAGTVNVHHDKFTDKEICNFARVENEIRIFFKDILIVHADVEIYSILGQPLGLYRLFPNQKNYKIQLPVQLPQGIVVKLRIADRSISKLVY
jgi:hypothetical protein